MRDLSQSSAKLVRLPPSPSNETPSSLDVSGLQISAPAPAVLADPSSSNHNLQPHTSRRHASNDNNTSNTISKPPQAMVTGPLRRSQSFKAMPKRRTSSFSSVSSYFPAYDTPGTSTRDQPVTQPVSTSLLDWFAGKGLTASLEPDRRRSMDDGRRPAAAAEGAQPLPILDSPTTWWNSLFGATKPDGKEASTVGVDSGEHEGGKDKYLEDDDKSRTDEPEWARIK